MVKVRMVEQSERSKWDNYVNCHPDASPYHAFAWKIAVEETYGHKAYYFLAEEDNAVVGILPVIQLRLHFLINDLVALPYCDVGGCLCNTQEAFDALLDAVILLKRKIKAHNIKLRGSVAPPITLSDHFAEDRHEKVRMFLSLPDSSEALLAGFKSKVRSQIHKAEKNGVWFRTAGLEGVPSFYSVYCRNMHDLGSPTHSRQWFMAIMTHYGEKARIGLAEYEGKCIGAGLILSTNSQAAMPWASTLREFNPLAPNMVLYWNLLRFSIGNGLKTFDFGRSTEGEGTYKFKRQWGAQPLPLSWYSLQKYTSQKCTSELAPSKTRGIMASSWRQLPLRMANFAGPILRKYISL